MPAGRPFDNERAACLVGHLVLRNIVNDGPVHMAEWEMPRFLHQAAVLAIRDYGSARKAGRAFAILEQAIAREINANFERRPSLTLSEALFQVDNLAREAADVMTEYIASRADAFRKALAELLREPHAVWARASTMLASPGLSHHATPEDEPRILVFSHVHPDACQVARRGEDVCVLCGSQSAVDALMFETSSRPAPQWNRGGVCGSCVDNAVSETTRWGYLTPEEMRSDPWREAS